MLDEEIEDEDALPSLPLLQSSLASTDASVRIEAVRQISAFVSEAYGEEGAELGQALRESGMVGQLAELVSDASSEVRAHALLALGNLCSDSVDPASSSTKALLLEHEMERALLANMRAEAEESVLLVACATLQNLCHDAAWARRVIAAGVEARLETLVSHADPRVVRYASGALKNLTIASATMGTAAPQLSAHANQAVRQRELEAATDDLRRRRALRTLSRQVQDMDRPARLWRVLRAAEEARDAAWLEAVSDLHGAIEEEARLLQFALPRASAAERTAIQTEIDRMLSVLGSAEVAVAEVLGDGYDEEVEEEVEEEEGAGRVGDASPTRPRPNERKVLSEIIGGGSGSAEDAVEEVPEAVEGEEATGGGSSRRQTQAVHMSNEANRNAAEQWLQRARERHEAGDDEAALKHCEKSLKLCENAAALRLQGHIRKYGAGSSAALAVEKVLAAADHYAVLELPATAKTYVTEADVKRAYKRLSLTLHPDRNHASGAEAAFKRLSESYTIVTSELAAQAGTPAAATTPRTPAATPPSSQSATPPRHAAPSSRATSDEPRSAGDGTPRAGPPQRRRVWERALGLGKKRSVERD